MRVCVCVSVCASDLYLEAIESLDGLVSLVGRSPSINTFTGHLTFTHTLSTVHPHFTSLTVSFVQVYRLTQHTQYHSTHTTHGSSHLEVLHSSLQQVEGRQELHEDKHSSTTRS